MNHFRASIAVLSFVCASAAAAASQPEAPQAAQQSALAPALVRLDGRLQTPTGEPRTGDVFIEVSLYAQKDDVTPLWVEAHTVTLDAAGRYMVVAGSTLADGIPREYFLDGSARWLGVGVQGEPEDQRTMFITVPYALKAGDANTLGGLPASAFLLGNSSTATRATTPRIGDDESKGSDANPPTGPSINDVVVPDDQIVQGSQCVGLDCINGEVFNFVTLKLKENNLRILFEDTSVGAFPTNDWQIVANDSGSGGTSFLAFEDTTGGTTPFKVTAGAPADAMVLSSTGKLGLRTGSPVLDIHTRTGDTPAFRFEQTGTSGFTPQTWDVAGNEANFFVRDITGGSRLPFRIRPGAPTSSVDISANGNVGIGQASAPTLLTLKQDHSMSWANPGGTARVTLTGSSGNTFAVGILGAEKMRVQSDGRVGIGVAAPPSLLTVAQDESLSWANPGGTARVSLTGTSANEFSLAILGAEKLRVQSDGRVGFGTSAPGHPLEMASGAHVTSGGVWTNASSRTLKEQIADLPVSRALAAFERLTPVTYVYKAEPGHTYVGFIAEDVPDLVATEDRKSLAAMDIVAVVTKVVQSQQQALAAQNRQLQEQRETIADLQSRLRQLEALLVPNRTAPMK